MTTPDMPYLKNGTVTNAKRWDGIRRDYTPEDVSRLSGSVTIRYTLAQIGAERLWTLINTEAYINALGALTGNQAMQQVKACL